MTVEVPDFRELAALEPRLLELEREARGVVDDGEGSFFCSNFVWLPMYTRLRGIVGVQRRPAPSAEAGQASESVEDVRLLYDSRVFERVYEYLSRLFPPCRDCGCRLFAPLLERQLLEF